MFDHGGMNRFYRLVWNEAKGCFVCIPEASSKRGKRKGGAFARMAAATVLAAAAASAAAAQDASMSTGQFGAAAPSPIGQPAANALPTGGQVVGGAGAISQSGSTQIIEQTSQNLAIDWASFNIGKDGKVVFNQPNAQAVALNRVIGSDPSQIFGVLEANGRVFLVNPNGVLFGKGAQVSVAGLLASTRDMSVADFMAGDYKLSGKGAGQVVNEGAIDADGGFVALVGAQVINNGAIQARSGAIEMAAANEVTLRLDNSGLTSLTIDQGGYDALVANNAILRADGGRIYLTAEAVDAVSRASVNNTGVIEARSLAERDGKIVLLGDMQSGAVTLAGKLDASSATGQGGRIDVTAHTVTLGEGAELTARGEAGGGVVRIGGGWQGRDGDLANASVVRMAPDARIDVSAGARGEGGTAVLWAEDHAGFYGSILARGGALGGNGGKVETSSRRQLMALGAVDAGADAGQAGQWLLDPVNVTIVASGAAGTSYSSSYNPDQDSQILASSIASSLNSGANVTITTGSTGSSAGDITVGAAIQQTALPGKGYNTLTLLAAGSINVNSQISTSQGRLNVVLTADTDRDGVGDINFGSAGRVLTNGGNFYAGALNSDSTAGANQRQGRNFTMAAGSFINVADSATYGYGGMLDIAVTGEVTLAANSLRNSPYYTGTTYYNNGQVATDNNSHIAVTAASLASANANQAVPDILTKVGTRLTVDGGSMGSSLNPIKISAGPTRVYSGLSLSNSGGDTHVALVGTQAFSTISLAVGSQVNSVHDVQIIGDANASGLGHIQVSTDGTGALEVGEGGVRTAGYGDVGATNVSLSAGNISFASGAVDTGSASFSANATNMSGMEDGVADIVAPNVTLNGRNIGVAGRAIELADNTFQDPVWGYSGNLYVSNNGGSTYLKSINDGFVQLNFSHMNGVGSHSMLFAGGDHIDYVNDGTGIYTPTITGGASDGQTFGATTGVALTRAMRGLTLTSQDGSIIFGDNSVDMGQGNFTAIIGRYNAVGVIAAENAYNAAAQVAQITASDVGFSVLNEDAPGVTTIGAGGKDIQIAKGAGSYSLDGWTWDPSLNVSTQGGDVSIHELTPHGFKYVSVSLGQANTAQTIAIDLAGADDINFSDDGGLIRLDASKVAVSDYNRSFSLSAGNRALQADSNAMTTGSYSLSGRTLALNGDIVTNGGDISLSGTYGVDLLSSVRIDSNSDRSGVGGNISFSTSSQTPYNGTISATGAGRSLTLDASSGDDVAGQISFSGTVDNRAGAYLGGLSLDSRSLGSGLGVPVDRYLGINSSTILLDGDFSASGDVYLGSSQGSFLLRTAASNQGSAGAIRFAGDNLRHDERQAVTLNASTSAANGAGGDVKLFASNAAGAFEASALTITAAGGAGGVAGDIHLGAVRTTGAQTYTGAEIGLQGNLTGNGTMTLQGRTTLLDSATLNSGSGALNLTGVVSAAAAGADLTLVSGGNVAALTLNDSAGAHVRNLSVTTGAGRSTTLAGVATEGSQTYGGGALGIGGALSTNGGDIILSGATSINLTGDVAITTDRAGGTNSAGQLVFGSRAINGSGALTIDTTADGGGAHRAVTFSGVGVGTAFSSIDVKAGSITLNAGMRSAGDITLQAIGPFADIVLNTNGRVTTEGAANTITLAAARNFRSLASSGQGLQVAAGSRYLVYSTDPTGTVEGMTGYNKHYNQTYSRGATPAYAATGNWFLYSIAPVIQVSTNGGAVVYGAADPSLTLTAANYSGFIDGDTLAAFSGTQTLSLASGALSGAGHRAVGTYAYTLDGVLTDNLGYQYAVFNENLTVTPKGVTLSGLSAVNRAYDGSTNVALAGLAQLGTYETGDVLQLDGAAISGSLLDKNAGTGKAVTLNGTAGLTGADAGNYVLALPGNLTADISAKALTISGSVAADKTYDATTVASVTAGSLSGLAAGESLGVSASGHFSDKHAGQAKDVATSYVLTDGVGGLASNYTLADEVLQANIDRRAIGVTAVGVAKTYDGSTNVAVTLGSNDILANDIVSFSGTGQMLDKNAGLGKAVMAFGVTAQGADADNYLLPAVAFGTVDVARKSVSVTAQGVDRTYDGSRNVDLTVSGAGVLSGDDVTLSGLGLMADKNVGAGKAVTVSGVLASGDDAANYDFAAVNATTVTISQKSIVVTGYGQKTYDGGTNIGVTLSSTGLVDGDDLTFSGVGALRDKNAGLGKAVDISAVVGAGADLGNYAFSSTASGTADVAKKAITIAALGQNKTYDGSTDVGVTLSSSDLVAGDVLSFDGVGRLTDKNAGQGNVVLVSGVSATGRDAGNYVFASTTATTADVAKKAIVVAAHSQGKVYDGRTDIDVTLSSGDLVAGDEVTLSGAGQLTDKNAGLGKAVAVSGILATGSDAGNYSYSSTTATTADVAKKAVLVVAQGQSKIYDGATAVGVTLSSGGVVDGDQVAFTGVGQLVDKNAGQGRAVLVSGVSASGDDASNYTFADTATGTADVARKAITVTAQGQGKTYDGATAIGVTLSSAGLIGADEVRFSGVGQLADKNAGQGRAVLVSNIAAEGADAGNYDFASTAATTADVARKAITIAAQGRKTYDGATAIDVALSSQGLVDGDNVAFTGVGQLADKNAGQGKAVTVSNVSATGSDAGNYAFAMTTSGLADVARKAITVAAQGKGKTYDGTTAVGVSLTSNGLVEGDEVAFTGVGQLADKNAGRDKSVLVSNVSASGADAANYAFASTAATTADVARKTITVAVQGEGKTYDGTTAVGVSLTSSDLVEGDEVAFTGVGQLADKNAGLGKSVLVSNVSASGADAGNYAFASTAATTADVARKAITVAAQGLGKTYDGTTAIGVSLASNGLVEGDEVAFIGVGELADKNAGQGRAVLVSNISGEGADARNYDFASTAATTADVDRKAITVAAQGQGKTYDGTTAVGVSLNSDGVVAGDKVAFTGVGQLADKNAGEGKAVSVTGVSASGADAGNYAFASNAATTADVARKAITVAAQGEGKTYDGTTVVGVSLNSDGVVAGDRVVFTGSGALADKNAGLGKAVSVTGVAASGADAGNYAFASTAATTADVARKAITVVAQGQGKTYDGTTVVGVGLSSGDVVAGDEVVFTGSGALADKNAGLGKTVSVTGVAASGADAGNYAFASTAATTADVARKAITVAAQGVDRTYDGTTVVGVVLSSTGVVAGDEVSFNGSGAVADRNAGQAKVVTVSGVAASGRDSLNYAVASTAQGSVNVAQKTITVGLQGPVTKVADGSSAVALASRNYSVSGLVAGDEILVTQSQGRFSDVLVGKNKTVSATLGTSDYQAGAGTSLGNYRLVSTTLTADVGEITAASNPAYEAAIGALPSNPTANVAGSQFLTANGSNGPAISTGESDNGVSTKSNKSDGGVAAIQVKETTIFRRTFSIAEGGIRLPAGVVDVDGDR